MDLAYAPPYSEAMDAIVHAANVIRNKIEGLAHGVSPVEMREKMESDEEFLFVDCRSNDAFTAQTIRDRRTVNVPLDDMRSKLDQLPRDREIILFCNTSITAYVAERMLRNLGYEDVKFLDGSIRAWPYDL